MTEAAGPGSRQRLPLYALLGAGFISLTGNMMTLLAVPWFVLQTTDSASQTGLAAFSFLLPVPIAGIFGGVLVDRLGFKPSSIVADIASGITVAAIPLLHSTIGVEYWQLLVLIFLGALLDSPGQNARFSMLPEVAEAAGMSLERASSAMQIVDRGARMLGAPLAGVLIALIGAESVLWLDAGTFAVSALLVLVLVPAVSTATDKEPSAGYWSDLAAGFRYLRTSALLLAIVLTVTATNFLDSFSFVLLPVYGDRVLDSAAGVGIIYACVAGGAVAGAFIYGAIGESWPKLKTFAVGFLIVATVQWLFVFEAPLPIIIAGALLGGLASGPINPIILTLFYERTPAEMRGRVFGIGNATAWLVMPLGVLLAGGLVDLIGLSATFAAMALSYLLVTMTAFFNPWLRELDEAPVAGNLEKARVEAASDVSGR